MLLSNLPQQSFTASWVISFYRWLGQTFPNIVSSQEPTTQIMLVSPNGNVGIITMTDDNTLVVTVGRPSV